MPRTGRPPKPLAEHTAAGTYRPGRHEPVPREPSKELPACPCWLDAEAKRKWAEITPELAARGLLTLVDGDALAAYCQAWAEFRWATETLQKEGRTTKRGTGGMAPHPATTLQRSAWKAIKDFASLFGLEPSSRMRLRVEVDTEEKNDDSLRYFDGTALG